LNYIRRCKIISFDFGSLKKKKIPEGVPDPSISTTGETFDTRPAPASERREVGAGQQLKKKKYPGSRSGPGIKKDLEEIKNTLVEIKAYKDLIILGQKHTLSETTLIEFFKKIMTRAKMFDLNHYFDENTSFEIQKLLDKFFKAGILRKNKNQFYYLNKTR